MRVTFVSGGKNASAQTAASTDGQTLLDVAHTAGVEVIAMCGGRGRCRSCRVKVLKGDVPPATGQDYTQLGREEVGEQFRLACQTTVIGDCTVLVAPPSSEVGYQVFTNDSDMLRRDGENLDSGVEQYLVTAPAITSSDQQAAHADRVLAGLPPGVFRNWDIDGLRKLPAALRDPQREVTVTVFNGLVVDIEPGDTRACRYGMAIDVGTTSIVATLLDLSSGARLAHVAKTNPQATFGGDLMSRIAFAQAGDKNFAKLRSRVWQTLNQFVTDACEQARVNPKDIYKIVIVGNPCMHHIVLGLDIASLGVAPYTPVLRDPLLLHSSELPLKRTPRARVTVLPLVAGFVGADAVAAMLATDFERGEGTRLLVDIGTNTEIIMARQGTLVACSAPAGPAFEGGQIRHGMRAAFGAIEAVDIDDDVQCRVIGGCEAIGICGSGLIDAVAKMLDAGLIEPTGLFRQRDRGVLPVALQNRFRENGETSEFVLVPADQSGRGEDITLTQGDIRQLQLAKGAIYAAIVVLQRVMRVATDDIDELLLCGGFGNYIDLDSALRIRMLPRLARGRVRYVGNAAHAGAEMALLSEEARRRADTLARRVTHVALTNQADFQDVFVDSLAL